MCCYPFNSSRICRSCPVGGIKSAQQYATAASPRRPSSIKAFPPRGTKKRQNSGGSCSWGRLVLLRCIDPLIINVFPAVPSPFFIIQDAPRQLTSGFSQKMRPLSLPGAAPADFRQMTAVSLMFGSRLFRLLISAALPGRLYRKLYDFANVRKRKASSECCGKLTGLYDLRVGISCR